MCVCVCSQWRPISSRLAVAQLQTESCRLHVIVCYAPTFHSKREAKENFYDELQATLRSISEADRYVLLGDFNARVGSRLGPGDEWRDVRGPHGVGTCNGAGRDLLSFLAINSSTICNTWFPKKPEYMQSWRHPGTGVWHAIDFIVVPQRDRRFCRDCRVVCYADCGSDHRMVCLTLELQGGAFARKKPAPKRHRYNVKLLRLTPGLSAEQRAAVEKCGEFFRSTVASRLPTVPPDSAEVSVEEHWAGIRDALTGAAEQCLGLASRHQPDWYTDHQDVLAPLIRERRVTYNDWIRTGDAGKLSRFKTARSRTRAEVRRVKAQWLHDLAEKADLGRVNCSGATVWSSIRDIQRSFQGLRPVTVPLVRDDRGDVCRSSEEQSARWSQHFQRVLNIESRFDMAVFDTLETRPIAEYLAVAPTLEELQRAISRLSNNKAPGSSGILPELIKHAGVAFRLSLLGLLRHLWRSGLVPQEWRDAELVPIPKKGDLSRCDNWRGIALLDVVGKVAGRLVQDRLQVLAEQELPESQCGFRRGRSCADQIFTVLQVVEKWYEHRESGFIIFVDLKKAYDSVPREALWRGLAVLGVPESLILYSSVVSFGHVCQGTCRRRFDGANRCSEWPTSRL